MSLQGPILIVAAKPAEGLTQAFVDAGAFPVIESAPAEAPAALAELKPSAVFICNSGLPGDTGMAALNKALTDAMPYLPAVVRVADDRGPALERALPVSEEAPIERVMTRLAGAQRVRTLHSTALSRARALKTERNIIAEFPSGDPLDEATVLLVGRGRHHATLGVAVGERMGVIGALSVDTAMRCLMARDVDGILIGDGLPASSVEVFLAALSDDPRFRDLPVGLLASAGDVPALPNFVRSRDPQALLQCAFPLIRLKTYEAALKRVLHAIECKGMIDARTGLLTPEAFDQALTLAIEDANERGTRFSLARFAFEHPLDRRTGMDAARLTSRLMREADFAARQDDGSILFVFGDTDLRDAHVAARRLASVLKHTMLRPDRDRPGVLPSVTLATLMPGDSASTLMARIAPRPVAAA